MTDDLRTRIIAALLSEDDVALMADAVIRELGMQQEDGECGYCRAQLPGCRYVTDWIADD